MGRSLRRSNSQQSVDAQRIVSRVLSGIIFEAIRRYNRSDITPPKMWTVGIQTDNFSDSVAEFFSGRLLEQLPEDRNAEELQDRIDEAMRALEGY